MTAITLVIPMYNEAAVIAESASAFLEVLQHLTHHPIFVFTDDGSTDDTARIAEDWLTDHGVDGQVLRAPRNAGKGAALTAGLGAVRSPISAYIDADLEIPAAYLANVLQPVIDGATVCVGSKSAAGATSRRALSRKIAHYGHNGMVRLLLGSSVSDHSCGIKAFRREVLDAVLPHMIDERWVWDTEFLVRAQREGYPVLEVPVRTETRRQSKVHFLHAATDSLRAVIDLYRRDVRVR